MATETPTPEPTEPVPAVVAPASPEPVVEPAPKTTPEPAATAHDPWLVHQAKELAISEAEIAVMTPAELQRSVVLLARQQARIAQELAKPKPAEPTPPPPEPEWDLPAAVKEKLAEVNPEVYEAIKLATKASADETKKLREELAKVQQESQVQAHRTEVLTELSKAVGAGGAPLQQGTAEFWKGEAILNQCRLMIDAGIIPPGTPPKVAIETAKKMLFGEAAPAKPTPPGNPAPTPSARPTNRLREGTEGLSARDALKRLYEEKLQAWDAEEQANSETNGSFRP